jgi:hypothetical protein
MDFVHRVWVEGIMRAKLNSTGLAAGAGWAHAVVKGCTVNAKTMQPVLNKTATLLFFILDTSF